jgi:Ca2+-binding EF-hand superfamily protein
MCSNILKAIFPLTPCLAADVKPSQVRALSTNNSKTQTSRIASKTSSQEAKFEDDGDPARPNSKGICSTDSSEPRQAHGLFTLPESTRVGAHKSIFAANAGAGLVKNDDKSPSPSKQKASGPTVPWKRLPTHWDPKASPFGTNTMLLVQCASAMHVERGIGGRISVVKVGSQMVKGGKRKTAAAQEKEDQHQLLQDFRKKLLAKHPNVQSAFNSLDVDQSAKLTHREWSVMITDAGFCTMRDARLLFTLLDADKSASVSLREFQAGLEAIAPAVTTGALRKRLICLGFSSTMQAIAVMAGCERGVIPDDLTAQPMSFNDFATALRRVWVITGEEHRALFDAVRDHTDPMNRVTLGELASGLLPVASALLLEEVRERCLSVWGQLPNAFEALANAEHDGQAVILLEGFRLKGRQRLGLTEQEAVKVFRLIDVNGSGVLEQQEFVGALRLAAPSLQLHDLRVMVRQSYRSIEMRFREAISCGDELNDQLHFSRQEFVEILEPVGFGLKDTKYLVNVICATSQDGPTELTFWQFFNCLRIFAPSFALDGLRLELLQRHSSVADAFARLENKRAAIDKDSFVKLMEKSGATSQSMDLVFDILDVRNSGTVVISEVSAALRCLEPGVVRDWVEPSKREAMAEQSVRQELAPLHKCASDLRLRVKRAKDVDFPSRSGTKSAVENSSKKRAQKCDKNDKNEQLARIGAAAQPVRREAEEGADPANPNIPVHDMPVRRSTLKRINSNFEKLPPEFKNEDVVVRTVSRLGEYFGSSHQVLSKQEPYLNGKCSRLTGLNKFALEPQQRPLRAPTGAGADESRSDLPMIHITEGPATQLLF